MVLKHYQSALLDGFSEFLRRTRELGNPAEAFQNSTKEHTGFAAPYFSFPPDADVPYVCLRVPTGGGKTLVAGHALQRVRSDFLGSNFLLTIWLVPSEAILAQTLLALRSPGSLLRESLLKSMGAFTVLDIDEALAIRPSTLNSGHTILVTTIQSFKQDTEDGLRVYRQNGDLMSHFTSWGANEDIDCSLASVIRSRRPFLIVDEAHSQGSPLALSTLGKLSPCCVLELTATPDRTNQPSNVLRSVSASTLQSEDMLKFPLQLATNGDWRTAMTAAIAQLRDLELRARSEFLETGENLDPIVMLIQAEKRSSSRETMTPDQVRRHLIEDYQVPASSIAIATGAMDELAGRTLGEPGYPQFIITVDKLREGWDCPNAYILYSFRHTTSATAVEQVLGRVLRMPHTRRKKDERLNQSYAFVVSDSLSQTAAGLRDGLVRSGFERYDTRQMIDWGDNHHLLPGFDEIVIQLPESESGDLEVPDEQIFQNLPDGLKSRVEVSAETGTLTVVGTVSKEQARLLAATFLPGSQDEVFSQLSKQPSVEKHADTLSEQGHVENFPLLAVELNSTIGIFDETSMLDAEWGINDFDHKLTEDEFGRDVALVRRMTLSMSERDQIKLSALDKLDSQLALFEKELGWTHLNLVSWLDKQLPFPYAERSQKVAWLNAAITYMVDSRSFSIAELGYRKFNLRGVLERKLEEGLKKAEQQVFDDLLALNAERFSVRDEFSVSLKNGSYAYDFPYVGAIDLKKHFFPLIGNLKDHGEEFECSQIIANEGEDVVWWIRNVERKKNSFWLQLPSNRFYPDFIAKLVDGTFVAIEYKGAHLSTTKESLEKRRIGQLWEERSSGKCRFVWIENQDWASLRRALRSPAG